MGLSIYVRTRLISAEVLVVGVAASVHFVARFIIGFVPLMCATTSSATRH